LVKDAPVPELVARLPVAKFRVPPGKVMGRVPRGKPGGVAVIRIGIEFPVRGPAPFEEMLPPSPTKSMETACAVPVARTKVNNELKTNNIPFFMVSPTYFLLLIFVPVITEIN
jgi:hypothetical protein